MKDAFGVEIKEGDVVMYSAGSGDDHGIKVGVVTGLREGDRSWNSYPVVKSYDKPSPYNQFTQGKMGRTGMPKDARCIVVPMSAVPQEAQDELRFEFTEYFAPDAIHLPAVLEHEEPYAHIGE